MSEYVTYAIKRQGDGQYAIVMKDSVKNTLTIHSNHDSFDEAKEVLDDLRNKPSQQEIIRFLNDLKRSINR